MVLFQPLPGADDVGTVRRGDFSLLALGEKKKKILVAEANAREVRCRVTECR